MRRAEEGPVVAVELSADEKIRELSGLVEILKAERQKASKDLEEVQAEKVSKARVEITQNLARSGILRPDPSQLSANQRAARRARQS